MAISLLPRIAIGSNSDGLTIKLTHRDSPKSPLYQPNVSQSKRTENLILQSIARAIHMAYHDQDSNATKNFNSNALRSKVDYQKHSLFMAQVGIGTFRSSLSNSSSISYFLHLDTGSSLIWTQCEGCRAPGHHCFHQKQPIFPDLRSYSYRKLVCDSRHPLCFPGKCLRGFCTYHEEYFDNSSSEGFLASETFTFESISSSTTQKETVQNIVFGCGFDQTNMDTYGDEGNIAGVLALGWESHSLLNQLGSRAQGRFSYCLQVPDINNHMQNTLLQFGSDIPNISPSLAKTTDLLKYNTLNHAYFVNLLDISIAGSRLRIPLKYFSRRSRNNRSGTVIDSGSSYTTMVKPAYDLLEQAMANYLSRVAPGLTRVEMPGAFRLCYQRIRGGGGEGFSNLPNVTFHLSPFQEAELRVQPQGAFYVSGTRREYFCLAVLRSSLPYEHGGLNIIGAYQQTNQRFIFDVSRMKLIFGQEDCTRNA
ncbi:Aspartic peptidase [Trema orientale]|uniref:Aspartic peptidase n=1 Tax=Trema orientale TaxID=63057 RepID=A0A2P5EGL4_TREOI|nr:Aspartic peptidase [Trema orientale]